MKQERYLLDTHTLIWFLTKDSRLPKAIYEDIYWMQNTYAIHILSIVEIMQLREQKRIDLSLSWNELHQKFIKLHFGYNYSTPEELPAFDDMPMLTINGRYHGDIVDRCLVVNAITSKLTLISHDSKFPHYRKYGLKLLEI